jgi:DNA-binding transcriptional regulator YhcF (GntR family)
MEWNFTGNEPVYLQIMEHFRSAVLSGKYPAGSRIPPVRDLAAQARVNPNTMQRALQDLEREGLVFPQRTAGRFVTEDGGVILRTKKAMAADELARFLRAMETLGYDREGILALLNEEKEETQDADP